MGRLRWGGGGGEEGGLGCYGRVVFVWLSVITCLYPWPATCKMYAQPSPQKQSLQWSSMQFGLDCQGAIFPFVSLALEKYLTD